MPLPAPQPLCSAAAAITIIHLAATKPAQPETLCLLTDALHLPIACIIIAGHGAPDDVLTAAEMVVETADQHHASHVVLASVRPHRPFEPADINRWFALDHRLADSPVLLLEWFVFDGRSTVAVSATSGEVPRWALPGG
ncbi:MAG: hypothetical protein ACKOD2_07720 [Ilumatobacteraceae bacterium]